MTISERDLKVIWHPFTQAKTAAHPVAIVKAEGCWLFDENGNKYLDATSSWWVNAHGHSHPYIVKKITEQIEQLDHIIFAGFTHEPAVKLAERLIEKLNGNYSRIFYSDNGSTSVEVALKMAFQYYANVGAPRKNIIALKNAYHGDTFGAMSVGERNAFSAPFNDLLFNVHFIDAPKQSNREEIIHQFNVLISEKNTAAFIFEPLVQGANGMKMYDAKTLSELIKICKLNNIITIADEVFTGFYRTGKAFAKDYLTEQPDIICLSKTLTGGTLPLGVTAAPEYIYNAFLSNDKLKTFFHGHSFTANPLSCTAALASFDLLEEEKCLNNIDFISQKHIEFKERIKQHPKILEARTLGTILAIELNTNEESGYLNPISEKITPYFLNKSIYLRPLGNVIYFTPPYTISEEELNIVYDAIDEWLRIN
jgi:adenosylmethionine---8-amino-7-oxononanoate aminotransferase